MVDAGHVWVSRAPMDSTRIKGFISDVLLADKDGAIDAMARSRQGEALPPERFPKEMYVDEPGESVRKLPDLALAGGFWTVGSGRTCCAQSTLAARRSTPREPSATTARRRLRASISA